jgi:hypothetical protein
LLLLLLLLLLQLVLLLLPLRESSKLVSVGRGHTLQAASTRNERGTKGQGW